MGGLPSPEGTPTGARKADAEQAGVARNCRNAAAEWRRRWGNDRPGSAAARGLAGPCAGFTRSRSVSDALHPSAPVALRRDAAMGAGARRLPDAELRELR